MRTFYVVQKKLLFVEFWRTIFSFIVMVITIRNLIQKLIKQVVLVNTKPSVLPKCE